MIFLVFRLTGLKNENLHRMLYNLVIGGISLKLYHSTLKKKEILENNNLKVSKRFNYLNYLRFLLKQSYEMKEPWKLKGSYPEARGRQAPFMGHGIYCFDNKENAVEYQSSSEVIEIDYLSDHSELDLDDALALLNLLDCLSEIDDLIDEHVSSEAVSDWKFLIDLLRLCIIEEFETSGPAVGLILFILEYFHKKSSSDSILRNFYEEVVASDLLIRSFYDKMNKDVKSKHRYFLIKNKGKIQKIS